MLSALGSCSGGGGAAQPLAPPSSALSSAEVFPDDDVFADGASFATVTVVIRDDQGAPIRGHGVSLATDTPTALLRQPAPTDALGFTTGQVASSAPGSVQVTATVERPEGAVELDARPTVTFRAAPSRSLSSVTASPSVDVPADGTTAAVIEIRLVDEAGAPLPGRSVALSTSSGTVLEQPSSTDSAGRTQGRVVAESPTTATVTALVLSALDPLALEARPTIVFQTPPPISEWSGTLFFRVDYREEYDYSDLFVLRLPRLEPELFKEIGWIGSIDVSPDGLVLAHGTPTFGTALIDQEGNELFNTNDRGDYEWTTDGRYLYFGDYFDGLYEVDTASWSSREVLNSASSTYDHSVAVSPDRQYTVWSHHEYGTSLRIYRARVADLPVTYADAEVIWDATSEHDEMQNTVFLDDRHVLVSVSTPAGEGLWVIDIDTHARALVVSDEGIWDFKLSNDGTRVAFATFDQVFVANVGSWTPLLVDDSGYANRSVAWSADDRYLAIAKEVYGTPSRLQVRIAATDGSGSWRVAEVLTEREQSGTQNLRIFKHVSESLDWARGAEAR